jgi:cysteine-rich repeat protein
VSPCSAGASCSACRCGPPPTTSTTLPAVGRCGDRRLDAGEECDDANTVPFDGCDGTCRSEQIVTGTPAARQTVATGDAASATDPFVVAVTVPVQGAVRIIETTAANEVAGYRLLDRQAVITAPEGEEGDPLSIVFGLDVSLLSPGTTAATLEIFWDDELVDDCDDDTVREASPDPCVFRRANATQPDGDLVFTVLTSTAGTWIFGTRIPPSTTTSTSTTSTSATTTTTTTSPPVALGRGTPRRTA